MLLKEILQILFLEKERWSEVTDEDKQKWFFIINRILSSKLLIPSFIIAVSNNSSIGMDIWYDNIPKQPIPNWVWTSLGQIKPKRGLKQDLLKWNLKNTPMDLDIFNKLHNEIDWD